ncbi:hypothetical protein L873DRAFT_742827 [Choiromyces venosus 120613-1]|uniref:Uncharacterized protein n=1 Tax=Choiromyces venosus 120613-1 TaxID=1336337 RepID=A0A3N4K4F2_9PEZI|nr:hypothetical protein L873DRAFT_742827 [Choiromyces venosus 120613-1]
MHSGKATSSILSNQINFLTLCFTLPYLAFPHKRIYRNLTQKTITHYHNSTASTVFKKTPPFHSLAASYWYATTHTQRLDPPASLPPSRTSTPRASAKIIIKQASKLTTQKSYHLPSLIQYRTSKSRVDTKLPLPYDKRLINPTISIPYRVDAPPLSSVLLLWLWKKSGM